MTFILLEQRCLMKGRANTGNSIPGMLILSQTFPRLMLVMYPWAHLTKPLSPALPPTYFH